MGRRRGVIFSYALLFAQVVSSLLFTPFLIRSLGPAEYGIFTLVVSITAYLMLLDAGVGNALVRYVAKFRVSEDIGQQKRFLGLSLVFYTGMSAVILLFGLIIQANLVSVFGKGLTPDELALASRMLNITLANAALSLILSVFDRTIIAYEHFALSKSLAIASVILRVMILTALLWLGYRAIAVVLVNLGITVLFGLVSAFFVLFRLELRPVFTGMQLGFIREVLAYSTFILISMAATMLNQMTDQIVLGIMTNSTMIGIYAVGALLAGYFQSIAGSINGVLMPGVVRMVEKKATPQVLSDEMVKVGRLIFMVLGPILVGFVVGGQMFVRLWAGADNAQAYWVALILMIPMLLMLTQAIGSQVLWAMGRHKVQAVLQIGVAVANVVLTVALIPWKPLVGAALGTAIAYVIGIVILNMVLARDVGISMKTYYDNLFRGITGCLLISGSVGGLVWLLAPPGWLGLVLELSSILLVYAATMLLFGMNPYEKGLVLGLMRKSGVRT